MDSTRWNKSFGYVFNAHGRFSAIRMEEGYLGLMRSGLETVQLTLEGKLPESPKGKHNE
jgi:hypothetical protein